MMYIIKYYIKNTRNSRKDLCNIKKIKKSQNI